MHKLYLFLIFALMLACHQRGPEALMPERFAAPVQAQMMLRGM